MTAATTRPRSTIQPAGDVTGARHGDYRRRRALAVVLAVLALLVVCGMSMALGSRWIDPATIWQALTDYHSGSTLQDIIIDQRMPRTLLGLLAGACLGGAGTLMQGITRNPLADPGLLGVNAGASLSVVLAITFLGVTNPGHFIWFALVGAAAATALVYAVGSRGREGATPVTLALAGTAVTAGVTSVITLLLLSNQQTMSTYRFWSVGSLAGRDGPANLSTTGALLPFLAVGFVLAIFCARQLNLIALGGDLARGLGLNLGLARGMSALAVVLLAGTATALAGPLVFVGLVVPHAARMVMGPDYRWILAGSLLFGPVMLLGADVLGRVIIPRSELEAGLVVAAVGAPVMIAIVRRVRLVQV